jgi:hypothetical protein
MVNRREFFSGFLKADKKQPAVRRARAPRYKHLETYVVADLIPYDLTLTADQDRELRSRVRKTLEASSDPDLFSMVIVGELEKLAEAFVQEIEAPPPPDTASG